MEQQEENGTAGLYRINKFIAAFGKIARRKADEYILQGRVTLNNITITEPGYKVNPSIDKVSVDGEEIKTDKRIIYIMLNKPEGIITTTSDEKRRKTVLDLVKVNERIFPIGRLDYNTTGILILTNDGETANKLMHPKYEFEKKYIVKLSRPLQEKHRAYIEKGTMLDGVKTKPGKIKFTRRNDFTNVQITITEGRNHQVKRIFEKFGYFVKKLHRSEYAGLTPGNLKEGEWRYLTNEEIKKLVINT
jgi:pseudouridine synthase